MKAKSQSPLVTASVTWPELSKTCRSSGSFSVSAKARNSETVTPRTSLPSRMAKNAEPAGATTTPPRSLAVGASCLRSSGLIVCAA
jgi:hypothetical protein